MNHLADYILQVLQKCRVFHWLICLYTPEYLCSGNASEESSRLQSSHFLSHDLSGLSFSLSDLKINPFFQGLALLRTWLKALFFSSNVEYDGCISYGLFSTGIFHVSIIFYPPAFLSWLDSATGP